MYVYIYLRIYMYIDLLLALRRSVARTFSGAAQRNRNRGSIYLVDGKYHMNVRVYPRSP